MLLSLLLGDTDSSKRKGANSAHRLRCVSAFDVGALWRFDLTRGVEEIADVVQIRNDAGAQSRLVQVHVRSVDPDSAKQRKHERHFTSSHKVKAKADAVVVMGVVSVMMDEAYGNCMTTWSPLRQDVS